MRRAAPAACLIVALGGAAAVGFLVIHDGSTSRRSAGSLAAGIPSVDPLRPPPAPALRVPAPRRLRDDEAVTLFAPVLRSSLVRVSASATAAAIGRLPARTPEATTNIAIVTGKGRVNGSLWVPIRAAALSGWVPRASLGGYESVDTHLLVDTRSFTATLERAGRTVFRARVGIGTADAPTPLGEFYVRSKLSRYRSAAYGPVAFGTSARSETLTDWPAGGFVGIHGTDHPELLPGRVSHGCIRMRNADILRLARLMPVGTPVTIR
jgi:lipoprotein-anchoring transpeptidase ErfK/SrfK